MALTQTARQEIEASINTGQVVLFMKGNRQQPQCGFSATVIGILDKLGTDYSTIDVLQNATVREGIKEFSSWPTIPQLYVDQEFLGGCDIVKQMFNTGDLHQALGVEPPDKTPPEISISDAAAQTMREALQEQPNSFVHLNVDAAWDHQLNLGPAEGHEVRAESNGITVLMDLDSAQRARGLKLDMTETLEGHGFAIDNPNAPPPVKNISPEELKTMLDDGDELHLYDVREEMERAKASINGSTMLDQAAMSNIEQLPKDARLVFYCHFGPRSQGAADHFKNEGYTNVHNLLGGVDAWAEKVDPSLPKY
jgi:monothiol glutaredoxin